MLSSRHCVAKARAAAAISLAVVASAAVAQTHYKSQVIQQPGDAVEYGGLTHSGALVGSLQVPHGVFTFLASYVKVGNKSIDFQPLGSNDSGAGVVTRGGDILGGIADEVAGTNWAYLRHRGGGIDTIAAAGVQQTDANGMNESDVVVGSTWSPAAGSTAFDWKAGVFTFHPSTFGGKQSEIRGINDAGWMVGDAEYAQFSSYAALWSPQGVVTNLGALPGASVSYAARITPSGVIFGGSGFDGPYLPCWWQNASSAPVALGFPAGTLDNNGFIEDVNASGVAVGMTQEYGLGHPQHAVVWNNGQATDLQTVTDLPAGLTLKYADSIADDGRIFALAETDGEQWYELVLTPKK